MKIIKYSKQCMIFLGLFICYSFASEAIPRKLHLNDIGCDMSEADFHRLLKSGDIKGYLTSQQFWNYFTILQEKYPKYISTKVPVGQTYLGNPLFGFYLGKNMNNRDSSGPNKNIVFITGLHHSREPITVTMVLFLIIQILNELGVCGESTSHIANNWKLFFQNNVIFFIPIVNEDSYNFIADNWDGPHGKDVLMIRKNRNISAECDELSGGVDLNRNYSFMFALNDQGSSGNPCDEDFRGSRPFSEPETRAIKKFVETHSNIVTGINMHSYGNAWIYPFNFVHDSHNHLLERKKPKFFNFYREFVRDMMLKHETADYGNAEKTVQYPTNGEAGDWLTEMHNVINLDVELGNLDKRSEQFYPPMSIIPKICAYNFKVFRQFFWKHNIDLELHQVKRNMRKKTLTFVIFNKSISSLINFVAEIYPLFRQKKKTKLMHKFKRKKKKKLKLKKHKLKYRKKIKRKYHLKKHRILSAEKKYTIYFATKANCNYRSADLKKADGRSIGGTLRGRYFLEIEFKFESEAELKAFHSINMDVHYGDGFTKKYEFLTHNVVKRNLFSKSKNKVFLGIFKNLRYVQERKLNMKTQKEQEQRDRRLKRAKDLPKLYV